MSSTPRNARGRFTVGVLTSRGDLTSKLLKINGHWLIPPWAPKPWRVRASQIREIASLFPEGAKPTIRSALWAIHFGERPTSRVYPTCGESLCVNPLHQEVSMSLSPEICQTVFQEALRFIKGGKEFTLRLPSEGKAIAYRFQLHTWRSKNREVISPEFDVIKIQLEEFFSPDEGRDGTFLLRFVEDRDDEIVLQAITEALGHKPQEFKTAQELVAELLEKGDSE